MAVDFFIRKEVPMDNIGTDILRHITANRIKNDKPCIILNTGDSGEGKSSVALKIAEAARPSEVKDVETFLTKQVIYTPFEYADKLEWILFNKEAKKRHVLVFMEARELVKAKTWYSVINQSIADVNAMSRSVKPLIFILVTQDAGDIDKDQRKPINFYGVCNRPLFKGEVHFKFYRVHKTRWLENPRMHQRTLKGIVNMGNNEFKLVYLHEFLMKMPNRVLWRRFRELDKEAKTNIIKSKLDRMRQLLEVEKPKFTRLEGLVEVIIREPSILQWAMKRTKAGRIRLKPELATLYNLSVKELRETEKILLDKLTETGMMSIEKRDKTIKMEELGEIADGTDKRDDDTSGHREPAESGEV